MLCVAILSSFSRVLPPHYFPKHLFIICSSHLCSILPLIITIIFYIFSPLYHSTSFLTVNSNSVTHFLSLSLSFSVFIFCLHHCLEVSIIIWFHSSLLSSNSRFSVCPLVFSLLSRKPSLKSSCSTFYSCLFFFVNDLSFSWYIEYNNYSSLLCLLSTSPCVLLVFVSKEQFCSVHLSNFLPLCVLSPLGESSLVRW